MDVIDKVTDVLSDVVHAVDVVAISVATTMPYALAVGNIKIKPR